MTFQDGQHFLCLRATRRECAGSGGECDTRFDLETRIKSADASFRVKSHAWVDARALQDFAEGLRRVQETGQGAAVLRSMSPGEFELAVRVYDASGHVGAFGKMGHWCQTGVQGPYWGEVNFGVPFDSSALPEVVREVGALAASQPFELPDDGEDGTQDGERGRGLKG
jgi:hypothetical protein